MNVRDWRTLSSATIAPLYQTEIARWDTVLHWDTRANWRLVEAARAAGTLPGVVVHETDGDVQGWAFYLLHHGVLQVGALVCRSPAATRAVLDAILDSAEAEQASSVTLFTFADAPAIAGALAAAGFATSPYRYLQCSLTSHTVGTHDRPADEAGALDECAAECRHWQAGDLVPVAGLLSRAYGPADASRPFARQGRPEEWIEYVEQLVITRGCGVFLPEATVIGETAAGVDAIVLATRLGPGTAHIAQVAVEPAAQRSGRGRLILGAALSNLREAGFVRATLLVSAANRPANRLYEQQGFVEAGRFIAAARDRPPRLDRAPADTGDVRIVR